MERLTHEIGVDEASVTHLLNRYGSDIFEVGGLISRDASLGERLTPALPYLRAEIVYAASHEGALSVTDVIARRTRISFESGDYGRSVAEEVADLIAPILGWSSKERAASLEDFNRFAAIEAAATLA